MKRFLATLATFAALLCATASAQMPSYPDTATPDGQTLPYRDAALPDGQTLPYRDASLPVARRVEDLLSRMTLEEKAGQLRVTLGWNYHERVGDDVRLTESFRKEVLEGLVGMIWGAFRADPWTEKSLDSGLSPVLAARAANLMQRAAVEETRLGIPLFLAEEAPHGHMAIGATVFPTGIGLAASFSPALMERVGRVIGQEVRASGGHVSYGPVMDLSRDPRWSRVEETLGEDPYLSGELGAALVRGLGGGRLSEPGSVVATLKHFIAYAATEGGHNGSQTVLGPRVLREDFLPPFRRAIEAGALSVMTAYNSLDGIPNTANGELLTDVLRGEWGFNGFVVSDLYAVDGLRGDHRVAATLREAAALALEAGVDADLGARGYATLPDAVRAGAVSEALLDRAVGRILRLKFEMGLFEQPYVDEAAAAGIGGADQRAVALDAARASVTLLKNNGILPLRRDLRIALIGPNADTPYNQLGDYTAPQPDGAVRTLRSALAARLPELPSPAGFTASSTTAGSSASTSHRPSAAGPLAAGEPSATSSAARPASLSRPTTPASSAGEPSASRSPLAGSAGCFEYVKGCAIRDYDNSDIPAAVAAAERADVVVVAIGGSSARDFRTSYADTGAAESSAPSDMDSGEGFDRATLGLLGRQQELLEALKATGKPLVIIYIEGRPMEKTWAAANADALLTAWYPGGEGGTALVDVLFGDVNPAGRLPVSVPRDPGQLPVYYNKRLPAVRDYMDLSGKPLYAFGYGLSYTTFAYSDLRVEKLPSGSVRASFDVTNTGTRDGDEVPQLYLRDEVASTVRPALQLIRFDRVHIRAGQTCRISFELQPEDFSLIDRNLQRVVEPGRFLLLAGPSSATLPLRLPLTL